MVSALSPPLVSGRFARSARCRLLVRVLGLRELRDLLVFLPSPFAIAEPRWPRAGGDRTVVRILVQPLPSFLQIYGQLVRNLEQFRTWQRLEVRLANLAQTVVSEHHIDQDTEFSTAKHASIPRYPPMSSSYCSALSESSSSPPNAGPLKDYVGEPVSLDVGGQVPVAGDLTFSATLTLVEGAQTVTVSASASATC